MPFRKHGILRKSTTFFKFPIYEIEVTYNLVPLLLIKGYTDRKELGDIMHLYHQTECIVLFCFSFL